MLGPLVCVEVWGRVGFTTQDFTGCWGLDTQLTLASYLTAS